MIYLLECHFFVSELMYGPMLVFMCGQSWAQFSRWVHL